MRSTSLLLAALLAAAFGLAGCIDAPHPFQPEAKPLPPEVAQYRSDPDLIVVTPVAGLDAPVANALAQAMATALAKRDVPISVEPKPDDRALYTISGRYLATSSGADHGPAIQWELRDAQGEAVARYDQAIAAGTDPAAPESRARLLADARDYAAREMVKGIEGDAVLPPDAAGATGAPSSRAPAGRSLVVTTIEGAPANAGDVALRRAIEAALKGVQVNVVRDRAADTLLLAAKVEVTSPDAATRHVKVTWRLAKPDGTVLGEVSQENDVPGRLLDQIWSEISAAVAENAAGSIAALVVQADAAGPTPPAGPGQGGLLMPPRGG
jgi:hypothetical protein